MSMVGDWVPNDPDSYAGFSFYTPVRAFQVKQVEGVEVRQVEG